ncbi:MAG: helix-turn-helix transcriptional regulator [candidate division WWE3 bacterium]|nr:helix-turn-helix transcriptional regulator [candidate division WWE3 bacterium]
MKREYPDVTPFIEEALKNPKIKAAYDRAEPEYAAMEAVLKARMEKGLTQTQLAKKMGTKQAVVSRLESGLANPSVKFLMRLADALDCRLTIRFSPCS